MKKPVIWTLALALAVLLSGCGSDTTAPTSKLEAAPPQTTASAPTERQPVETEPAETAPVETTSAGTEDSIGLGRMEGGTYTNEYAGFGCTLDSNWVFYSAEELQEIPDNVAELFEEGSDAAELLEGVEQITDMMAENVELLCGMNVLYQRQSLQDRLVFATMGEAELIDRILEEQGDMFREAYAQAGMDIVEMKRVEVTFLGETHSALYTLGSTQDVPVYMVQLLDYSRGSYGITTTFTSYLEDHTEDMLALFFKVE